MAHQPTESTQHPAPPAPKPPPAPIPPGSQAQVSMGQVQTWEGRLAKLQKEIASKLDPDELELLAACIDELKGVKASPPTVC
jgi:hypothetical protein